jgi:hypothetical protein
MLPAQRKPFIFLCTLFLTLSGPFAFGLNPSHATEFKSISLKKYPQTAFPVPNPMVISKLEYGKTFQVSEPHFILQFFFNNKNIMGMILKRDKKYPIRVRWCFFKNCEESPFDYKSVIAEAYSPPFDQGFFEIRFPPGIQYQFQGLEFSSSN